MPGLVPWNLRSLWRWQNLNGFGWVWWMVSWNSNMFTRFGFEQIACQQNAMFLADVGWKSLCFGPDFGSKTACLCTVGPIGDFPFLVSNSWCVHPRLCFSSFSSSATRLGGWALSCLTISWISDGIDFDFIVLVDFFTLIWCHASISGWGKKRKKVPGTVFKQGVDLWTNCRSEKTDKQSDLISYSLSWASPSWTRHDVPLKDQVPRPSWKFVQLLTVALLHGSFKNQIYSPCLGFEYWAFGMV